MATFVFKAMDLAGVPAGGEVEANSKQDVADQLKERGLIVIDIAYEVPLQGAERRHLRARQSRRSRDRHPAALDDGHLRDDDPALAVRA